MQLKEMLMIRDQIQRDLDQEKEEMQKAIKAAEHAEAMEDREAKKLHMSEYDRHRSEVWRLQDLVRDIDEIEVTR